MSLPRCHRGPWRHLIWSKIGTGNRSINPKHWFFSRFNKDNGGPLHKRWGQVQKPVLPKHINFEFVCTLIFKGIKWPEIKCYCGVSTKQPSWIYVGKSKIPKVGGIIKAQHSNRACWSITGIVTKNSYKNWVGQHCCSSPTISAPLFSSPRCHSYYRWQKEF